jgi:hypothetical protein
MSNELVVVISWQSSVMPVAAYNAFHERCYTGTSFSNQELREVPVAEVSMSAVCCGCGGYIREEEKVNGK